MFAKAHIFCSDASISVENADLSAMESLAKRFVSTGSSPGGFLGLGYEIFDASDAFKQFDDSYAIQQREQARMGRPINSRGRFDIEFDCRPFAVSILLDARSNPYMQAALPYLAEWLGREIAQYTKLRTLIMFNEWEIPYRLYAGSYLVADFAKYYVPVFGERMALDRNH